MFLFNNNNKKAREKLIRKTEDTFHKTAQVGLYMKVPQSCSLPWGPSFLVWGLSAIHQTRKSNRGELRPALHEAHTWADGVQMALCRLEGELKCPWRPACM